MKQYQKKPVVITAVQLCWKNWSDVCSLLGDALPDKSVRQMPDFGQVSDTCGEAGPYIELDVTTVHGDTAVVRHGDWIIPDGKPGTFYPCKPDIFAATYESADAAKNADLSQWYHDLEDDNWGDAAEVFRDRISVLETALAFAASCIKSGEPWSPTCEEIIGGAQVGETRPTHSP